MCEIHEIHTYVNSWFTFASFRKIIFQVSLLFCSLFCSSWPSDKNKTCDPPRTPMGIWRWCKLSWGGDTWVRHERDSCCNSSTAHKLLVTMMARTSCVRVSPRAVASELTRVLSEYLKHCLSARSSATFAQISNSPIKILLFLVFQEPVSFGAYLNL